MLFFLLLINFMFIDLNCFSQVSDVAHGPLVCFIWQAPGTNHPALFCQEFYATVPMWIHSEPPGFSEGGSCQLQCQFQRKWGALPCTVTRCGENQVRVYLRSPQRCITPGQYAVFYSGEECLGSGVITTKGPSLYDIELNSKVKVQQEVSWWWLCVGWNFASWSVHTGVFFTIVNRLAAGWGYSLQHKTTINKSINQK